MSAAHVRRGGAARTQARKPSKVAVPKKIAKKLPVDHAREFAENFVVYRKMYKNFNVFGSWDLQGTAGRKLHHVGWQLGSPDLVDHARHK